MKGNRQKKILEIINQYHVETQDDLIERLLVDGYSVTQATVSRDIRELQLTKILTAKGTYRYVAPKKNEVAVGARINTALINSVTRVDHAQNIVVIHTLPGLAQAVAAGIDNLMLPEILGSVAGDDTIMVVTRNDASAKLIGERVRSMMKFN